MKEMPMHRRGRFFKIHFRLPISKESFPEGNANASSRKIFANSFLVFKMNNDFIKHFDFTS
ncbi:hypothetical protein KFY46_26830, partial [Salmonella enterica subsp. enterica serovar 1,4,[5],12:i:-]|nr:hypothetical protein [Salmonella enterica subsp. enterica serovar 1,4,[5],12:i:-]